MVKNVTGPEIEGDTENKIIKSIAKEVTISKENMIITND